MAYFISSFSEKCGVNKESIRYYERKNLLPEPDRTNSGYRVYSEEDVKLGVVDKDNIRCEGMFEFVSKKEREIQKKIENLNRIEYMLKDLRARCPDEKELYACPIIEVLIEN